MTPLPLEEVLANHRGAAAVLRSRGLADRADDIELLCEDIASSMARYLTWLGEGEAALWTGRSRDWLAARRQGFAAAGDARKLGRGWQYRASALPRTADLTTARARGRRLAEAA